MRLIVGVVKTSRSLLMQMGDLVGSQFVNSC